jgi:hypothetical protein
MALLKPMETKALIIALIQANKRYWGKLLYETYFDLFQAIHSSELLAKWISQDLGFDIHEKQIKNIKQQYHKKTKTPTKKKLKTDFDLKGL